MKSLTEKLSIYRNEFEKLNENCIKSFPENDEQFITEYTTIPYSVNADIFFEKYGVGNYLINVNRPFEQMEAYELLLDILFHINKDQYKNIHKGTPFYFLAWTSYQLLDYSKAMFYVDAAVSEDIKILSPTIIEPSTPTLAFFLQSSTTVGGGITYGYKMIFQPLISTFMHTLQEYHESSGRKIEIDIFRKKFVQKLLKSDSLKRTILTALYTFLLEYAEKKKQIKLRSDTG